MFIIQDSTFLIFQTESLDDSLIMEIQVDEKYILEEWGVIDQEIKRLGLISFSQAPSCYS